MRLPFLLSVVALAAAGCTSNVSLGDPAPGENTGDPGTVDPGKGTTPVAPEYPAGPYGVNIGDTFPNLCFPSYRNGVAGMEKGEFKDVCLGDYFDPDGKRGINAVQLTASALWCGYCKQEASRLGTTYQPLYDRGARIVTAIIENASSKPATQDSADIWIKSFNCKFDVGIDPEKKVFTGLSGSIGLPYNVIIDPRTMQVVKINKGDTGNENQLEALVKKNGG